MSIQTLMAAAVAALLAAGTVSAVEHAHGKDADAKGKGCCMASCCAKHEGGAGHEACAKHASGKMRCSLTGKSMDTCCCVEKEGKMHCTLTGKEVESCCCEPVTDDAEKTNAGNPGGEAQESHQKQE